jgi:hypothetical protein
MTEIFVITPIVVVINEGRNRFLNIPGIAYGKRLNSLTGLGNLFAKLSASVYNVFNSLSLGYYKLHIIPSDSYRVLDGPDCG